MGLTLVDVGGGQAAGSPVLSQAPPPSNPSGQIKNLGHSDKSKLGSRRGWALSGEDRIRTGPLPPHQRAASEPATCPPTRAGP